MYIKGPFRFEVASSQTDPVIISPYTKDSDGKSVDHDFQGKFSDHLLLIESDANGTINYKVEVMIFGRYQELPATISPTNTADAAMRLPTMTVKKAADNADQVSAELFGRHIQAIKITPGAGPNKAINIHFQSRIAHFGKP